MAASHVAFLRGINVGTAKRVAMADLRGLMTGLGYSEVRTLLNSGNVVFTAPPRSGDPSKRLLVGALATRDDRSRLESLTRKRWGLERLALGERVCYLWCPDGVIKSPLMRSSSHRWAAHGCRSTKPRRSP
jgi:hypothetical protein